MATDIAYISAPIVKWAIARAKTNTRALSAKLKSVSPSQIEAWERGEAFPTFSQAVKLAEQLRVPLAVLFMPEPPAGELQIPDLRTIAGTPAAHPSVNFFEVIKDSLIRQRWFREFQEASGARPLEFVGRFTLDASARDVASDMARVLGINNALRRECTSWMQFFTTFIQRADDIGVLVMRSGVVRHSTKNVLDVQEFRGFVLIDSLAPLVFINARDSKAAQVFTLAHELAHIWLGQGGISNLDPKASGETPNRIERLCNSIAAELLVPAAGFEQLWSSRRHTQEKIQSIASFYRVSAVVAIRRAYELHKLSYDAFSDLLDAAYERFGNQKAQKDEDDGGNFWNTFGARSSSRLVEAVVSSVRADSLQYREAANLLGLKVGTLHRFIESHSKR